MTLLVSQFDISGNVDIILLAESVKSKLSKDFNSSLLLLVKISKILFWENQLKLKSFIFNFSNKLLILSNEIGEENPQNIKLISSTFFVFHSDISGNCVNDEHPKNK